MAYKLKSNPDGCVCAQRRGERSCLECYWSQVEAGSWTGTTACFNAECITLGNDKQAKDTERR